MKIAGPAPEVVCRVFDFPSSQTFTIPAIKTLLRKYMNGGVWGDPFAGFNSPADIKNDLNPDAPVFWHEDAEVFACQLADNSLDGVLFDPPYSPRQISECYRGIGRHVGMEQTQNGLLYARVRRALVPKLRDGGIAISFGWNSTGFGLARGFERIETLLVNHGAAHNDTIVTVERKLAVTPSLFSIASTAGARP